MTWVAARACSTPALRPKHRAFVCSLSFGIRPGGAERRGSARLCHKRSEVRCRHWATSAIDRPSPWTARVVLADPPPPPVASAMSDRCVGGEDSALSPAVPSRLCEPSAQSPRPSAAVRRPSFALAGRCQTRTTRPLNRAHLGHERPVAGAPGSRLKHGSA